MDWMHFMLRCAGIFEVAGSNRRNDIDRVLLCSKGRTSLSRPLASVAGAAVQIKASVSIVYAWGTTSFL
jgi:hypothetical protein